MKLRKILLSLVIALFVASSAFAVDCIVETEETCTIGFPVELPKDFLEPEAIVFYAQAKGYQTEVENPDYDGNMVLPNPNFNLEEFLQGGRDEEGNVIEGSVLNPLFDPITTIPNPNYDNRETLPNPIDPMAFLSISLQQRIKREFISSATSLEAMKASEAKEAEIEARWMASGL